MGTELLFLEKEEEIKATKLDRAHGKVNERQGGSFERKEAQKQREVPVS